MAELTSFRGVVTAQKTTPKGVEFTIRVEGEDTFDSLKILPYLMTATLQFEVHEYDWSEEGNIDWEEVLRESEDDG